MTTKEVKQIPIIDLLGSLGYLPEHSQKNGNEFWYKSPMRKEKTPSFKVTVDKNTWYDFGAAAGGSVVDLVMAYKRCDVAKAFAIIKSKNITSVTPLLETVPVLFNNNPVEVRSIKPLQNSVLISFLKSRGLSIEIAGNYINEIYYRRSGKDFFTVGMKNDSDGYEIRTKTFKGCILSKDLTTLKNGFDTVSIFEGFIDFLSLLTMKKINSLKSDVIILHSTSQINKAVDKISNSNYNKLFAFVDNDKAGETAFLKLKNINQIEVKDMRHLYDGYNDLNDKLLERKR